MAGAIWRNVLVLAALVSLVTTPIRAQAVRGVVLHQGTREPVSLALVLLVDSAGQTLSRALTNDSGRFRFATRPTDPGASIRAERIGLGAVTIPLPSGRAAEAVELILSSVPVRIDGLVVEAVDQCPADPNDERLAQAWSQFRPLLASLENVRLVGSSRFEVR